MSAAQHPSMRRDTPGGDTLDAELAVLALFADELPPVIAWRDKFGRILVGIDRQHVPSPVPLVFEWDWSTRTVWLLGKMHGRVGIVLDRGQLAGVIERGQQQRIL